MKTSPLLFIALSSIPTTLAWGALGHETIAYVATHYVQSSTREWAQAILNDTSTSYLANVATWADSFRYTAAGSWSAPFHFIDAEDNPPSSCNVDYDRDCGSKGCSISAIANYTRRVQSTSLPAQEVNYALRFLVHFIGDITQPLHDEAYEVGGNDVDVTFNGTSTNLHHVWDTNIPEQLRGGYSLSYAKAWAADLIQAIDSGSYSSPKSSWLNGLDVSDPKGTALTWAEDANTLVCSAVMPDGAQELSGETDLYPSYYDDVVDTVELQVAKAGYRLAKWLDEIVGQGGGVGKREVWRRATVLEGEENLGGEDLLSPLQGREMSRAERRREAIGYGCKH